MRALVAILLIAGVACVNPSPDEQTAGQTFGNPTSTTNGPSDSSGTPPTTDADTGSTTTSTDSSGGGTSPKLDVASDDSGGPLPEVAEVFGHSADILYRLDPDTKEVTEVGPFAGCTASIIDIALDADSRMYGTAFSSLWSIDRLTGDCTMIAEGSYTTSLSFVPAGTVDPEQEALVGFDDEQYVRIDTETGAVTTLGTLSDGLASSGDLVSVNGGGSYLTVRGPGCEATDCIVEIDPTDGTVLQNFGPLPYDQVFGVAFWAGRAYGFAREGVLFEIEFNGGSVSTTPIPIPGAPPGLEFFGAGSTTSAPPAEG